MCNTSRALIYAIRVYNTSTQSIHRESSLAAIMTTNCELTKNNVPLVGVVVLILTNINVFVRFLMS